MSAVHVVYVYGYSCRQLFVLFIVMFRIKKHKRDSSQLQMAKQFVAWTMDRHFRATPDQRVVVLYDMTQAGRANIVGGATVIALQFK